MSVSIGPQLEIPDYELWYTASRSGGPGGQHVNTTSSKITLHWSPADSGVLSDDQKRRVIRRLGNRINRDGVLMIDASEHRSQHRNKEIAQERLAELIRRALEPRKRRKRTRPTRGSIERRLKAKRITSERKKTRSKVDLSKH